MIKKLKARWNISSNFQLIAIFTVFSLTGLTATMLRPLILTFLGLTSATFFGGQWYFKLVYYLCSALVIFTIYQTLLVVFAFFLGQFTFFWEFEKKILSRIGVIQLLKKLKIVE